MNMIRVTCRFVLATLLAATAASAQDAAAPAAEMRVYDLVIARSDGPTNISLHGDGQEIPQLIAVLTQLAGRQVRDKTGLTGRYDFDMKLDLQTLLRMAQGMGVNVPAEAANIPQSDGSSLMTALNEQLGLTLDSVRAPVDVLIVDNVEAPATD